MKIGLDLDNTISCYSEAIDILSKEHLELPSSVVRTKKAVREYLKFEGKEEIWVDFQGILYGPGMKYAKPYPGCIDVIRKLENSGFVVCIISHRSRYPYGKTKYDLHGYAREWVTTNLLSEGLLSRSEEPDSTTRAVTFYTEKDEKVKAIKAAGCNIFLDDLPSILSHPLFPSTTIPFLFRPIEEVEGSSCDVDSNKYRCVSTWIEFLSEVMHCVNNG